ncbi:MAG: hypothetical protein WDW36_002970 [Sanguina aurantia]
MHLTPVLPVSTPLAPPSPAVASRVLFLATSLGMTTEDVARMCCKDGRLLARRPEQLSEQVSMISSILSIAPAAVVGMAAAEPRLLTVPAGVLAESLHDLVSVCGSAGLKVSDIAQKRPDLLLQSAASLRVKIESLPALLGVTPRSARDVLLACPQLLRRSPAALAERFTTMQTLFGIPGDFLNELVVQEPRVLSYSPSMLTAKFESLVRRNRAFENDVADMILVEPSLLVNAVPAPPRPPQQRQLQQREQQQRGQPTPPSSAPRDRSSPSLFGVFESNLEAQAAGPQSRNDSDASALREGPPSAHTSAAQEGNPSGSSGKKGTGSSSKVRTPSAAHETVSSSSSTSSSSGSSRSRVVTGPQDPPSGSDSDSDSSSGGNGGSSSSGGSSRIARPAVRTRTSVLDSLLLLSSGSGVPLTAVLQLCVVDDTVLAGGREGLDARLTALGTAMSMDAVGVKSAVTTHPGLLAIPQAELDRRRDSLQALLQPKAPSPASASNPTRRQGAAAAATAGDFLSRFTEARLPAATLASTAAAAESGDGSGSSTSGGSSGSSSSSSMVARHPELLLSAPEQVERQLQQLGEMFDLSMAAVLVMVAAAPSLALRPVSESGEKLLALQSLFEVPRPLVVELLCKEPALLQLEVHELEARFKALAATFGSFTDDALMMVLADPSMLMRAGAGKALRSYDEEEGGDGGGWEGEMPGGAGGRGLAGGKVTGDVLPSRRRRR